MSLGRVSFSRTQKDGVVFVYGLYQAKVGDGDSLHSFAFRKGDKYGGGMHSWAVAGSDAGGSITKILEDVYNTGKINPCITASKITVDKVKYTVSFYFEIQDSPDGKAYTGFSSWGGAGGSTSAPSGHAYDNYKKEYDAVVKKNPTVTIAPVNDFWFPAFFRQVFFQYTRKKFPNLQKGAKSKKGTVGVSINKNSPPKNNDVKVLAYNPTGVQPVTAPGLSTVVFTETVAETEEEAPSNEAVVEVNAPAAPAAPPDKPLVPRVPDFAPDKIFTFNVEKSQKNSPLSGFWFSPEAGTFSIVPFEPEFQFTGDEDEQLLDDEYIEVETSITEEITLFLEKVAEQEYEKVLVSSALKLTEKKNEDVQDISISGGGTMLGSVGVDYKVNGSNWGKVKKGMNDASLLQVMVSFIEGGYYYPAHAYSKFSQKDRELYGASGETLWGVDRFAGKTETTAEGKDFWAEVDKISGHGNATGKTGYAKSTSTKKWNNSLYPCLGKCCRSGGTVWKYGYSPLPGSAGYDIMYNSFVKYALKNFTTNLDGYFKSHPVKNLILSDSRFKFLWFRATWNGPGWSQWYAKGKSSKGIKGLIWAYDNVTQNLDELIIWDLNNRLKFNNGLITHDVKKMAELLGIAK